jgi:hypothetical protein
MLRSFLNNEVLTMLTPLTTSSNATNSSRHRSAAALILGLAFDPLLGNLASRLCDEAKNGQIMIVADRGFGAKSSMATPP